jgi:uncharacterized repeat protein (TIGR01451 family)
MPPRVPPAFRLVACVVAALCALAWPLAALAKPLAIASADMQVTMSADRSTVVAGTEIAYTITVLNSGPDAATSVALSDTAPAGTEFTSFSVSTGSAACTLGPTLTCTAASMANGASFMVIVHAQVAGTRRGTLTNTATVSSATFDPNAGNSAASFNATVAANVDTSVTLDVSPDPATAGLPIGYTFTLANAGPSTATGVTLTVSFAAGTTASGSGCTGTGTVTCTTAAIAAGSSTTFVLGATVDPARTESQPISLTASVSSAGGENDANLANNVVAHVVYLGTSADVRVAIDAPATAIVGDTVTYRITVNNAGPSLAEDVALSHALPAALTGAALVAPVSGCQIAAGRLACTWDSLAPAASVNVDLTGPLAAAAAPSLAFAAGVSSGGHDPMAANDSAGDAIAVSPLTSVSVTASALPSESLSGAVLPWTLVVHNAGPSAATGVTLTATLSDGVHVLSVAAGQGGCTTASGLTCSLGTLAAGQDVTVTVLLAIDLHFEGDLTAAVAVAAAELDGITTDNECSGGIGVARQRLAFAADGTAAPGAEWLGAAQSVSPSGESFFGEFGTAPVRLSLAGLPAHNTLLVTFDLYVIRSWDGVGGDDLGAQAIAGPDTWQVGIAGEQPWLLTTFSNWDDEWQSYPGTLSGGDRRADGTGAVARNTLGYRYGGAAQDATYHLAFGIAHSGDGVTLEFRAAGLQALGDESWGLDNVQVYALSRHYSLLPGVWR